MSWDYIISFIFAMDGPLSFVFFLFSFLGYNHKVFCTVLFYSFHHIIAISFATHCECVCL